MWKDKVWFSGRHSSCKGCGLPTIKGLKYTMAVIPNWMMAYAMDTHMSLRKFIPQNGAAAAHHPLILTTLVESGQEPCHTLPGSFTLSWC